MSYKPRHAAPQSPLVMKRRVYFHGRWWDAGVMVEGGRITRASWPDNARRVYSITESVR